MLSGLITLHIKRVLDALNLNVKEIDYFACGLGPGSFTGLRIGIATIKALAWAQKKPVVGIPTLDILAQNVKLTEGIVVPIIDAKRNLIYTSTYRIKDKRLKRITRYMLLGEKEFFKKAKDNSIILGDAIGIYRDRLLRNIKGVTLLDRDYWYPQAGNLISLAEEKIKNRKFNNAFEVKPIYLYPKECQIKNAKIKITM